MIEHPLVLEGVSVRLKPLEPLHIPPLLAISRADPDAFKYTSTPTTDAEAEAYFAKAFGDREAGAAYPFVITLSETGEVVGMSRFSDIRWPHRGCELGYTWLAPRVQGGTVNPESKYLMLRYAFETLRFLRVYLYTDARNGRSQRAIGKLGAVYEGTLRAERVMKDGFVRDTMVFSIIHTDWPLVKRSLEARLGYVTA